jgi:hypothetical protein
MAVAKMSVADGEYFEGLNRQRGFLARLPGLPDA